MTHCNQHLQLKLFGQKGIFYDKILFLFGLVWFSLVLCCFIVLLSLGRGHNVGGWIQKEREMSEIGVYDV